MTIREQTYDYFKNLFEKISKSVIEEIIPLQVYRRSETNSSKIGEEIVDLYLKEILTPFIIEEQGLEIIL